MSNHVTAAVRILGFEMHSLTENAEVITGWQVWKGRKFDVPGDFVKPAAFWIFRLSM